MDVRNRGGLGPRVRQRLKVGRGEMYLCLHCILRNVTSDERTTVEKDYGHGIRVVRVDREDEQPLYRFEAPMMKPKDSDNSLEWENPELAKLYAAVYVAVGTFREEKTGRRGIPPEVERDGREAVVAYLSTQRGMTTEWIEHFYDYDRERIYEYRSRIRARAEEQIEESEE